MSCPTCSHRKADGILCGSPALHGQRFCYFHTRQRREAIYGARARRRHSEVRFTMPPLDDFQSIHEMLQVVFDALCTDTIDYRRASAMLSTLKFASNELRNPSGW